MPEPINENVDRAVEATLKSVREQGGFNVTLEVEPFRKDRNDAHPTVPGNLLCVMHVGDDQKCSDNDTPDGFTDWWRPYIAQIFIELPTDGAVTRYDTLLNRARADVEKAVMTDVQQGGACQNTEMMEPARFGGPDEASGVLVVFACRYRTLEGDPYRNH